MKTQYHVFPREEANEKLEDFLLTSELPAHSRLPSERSLCEKWGMNRATLRYAVNMMVEQGLLYRVKGKGTYISPTKLVRNMLGVSNLAKDLHQQSIPLTTRILSMRVIEATKQISRKMKIPLGESVYECIRLRTVRGIPCTIETLYIDCAHCPRFDEYYSDKASIRAIYSNIYGFELTSGEEKISVTYVSAEEGELLDIPEGTPVFFASGYTMLDNGEIVEYYKQLFRADCFRFVSMIDKSDSKEVTDRE